MAFLIVQPILNDPGAHLMDSESGDPEVIQSVAELATLASAVEHFHSQGNVFLWPDGVSGWTLSSGWLSQIPPAILSATVDPIIGHNISVAVGMALLCFFSWALIKALGASQGAAWMGAVACTLAPRILQDLDSQSIEQCSLFLVPLFLLNIHQAFDDEGPWPSIWPVEPWRLHSTAIKPWVLPFVGGTHHGAPPLTWTQYSKKNSPIGNSDTDHQPVDCTQFAMGRQHFNGKV